MRFVDEMEGTEQQIPLLVRLVRRVDEMGRHCAAREACVTRR